MMKVVHCMREKYDVYIGRGRGSIWGNPFTHKDGTFDKYKVDTREEAVARYREYILNSPRLLEHLHELKGKTLGCWCHPQACHGDVFVELIKERYGEE